MKQLRSSRDASSAPLPEPAVGVLDGAPASLSHVPPHVLWASLEEAFVTADDGTPVGDEPRFPGYVGLAITLAASLSLWALIVRLVLLH